MSDQSSPPTMGPLSGMPPAPPRRKASATKKGVLLGVWIVLLGVLGWGLTHFGTEPNTPVNPNLPDPAAPRYTLDLKKMAAAWPSIVAHAVAPPRGPADAPYTLAEFGDFQCPQCGKAYPVVENLLAQNPKAVNLLFVHRPFPKDSAGNVMHQWAIPSAVAANAAAKQGKFWPMYDLLYTHQDDLEPGFYPQYAKQLGLNVSQFTADSNAPTAVPQVAETQKWTQDLGIIETPTFLLRNNKTGTVTAYVGTAGTKLPNGQTDIPGVGSLLFNPPWQK